MKTLTAVKTKGEAYKRISDWLFYKNPNYPTIYIDDCEARCKCGQTRGLVGYGEGDDQGAKIAICEICGDDDAFNNEVIEIV